MKNVNDLWRFVFQLMIRYILPRMFSSSSSMNGCRIFELIRRKSWLEGWVIYAKNYLSDFGEVRKISRHWFTLAIVYFDIYNKIIINYDNNTRCETSVYVCIITKASGKHCCHEFFFSNAVTIIVQRITEHFFFFFLIEWNIYMHVCIYIYIFFFLKINLTSHFLLKLNSHFIASFFFFCFSFC